MDKRFMKGRLALVALIAVLCIAIPAAAFAASSNTFPGSSTTTPGVVGVTFTGVSAASAQITIDGNARLTKMDKASSVSGSWVTEDVDAGAAVVIKWVWKPTAAADGQIKVYAFPTSADGLTAGPHAVIATVYDSKGAVAGTANWSYTIDQTIVNSGTEPPGTVVDPVPAGCSCHAGYNTKAGMGPVCDNCHSGQEAPLHGNPMGSADPHAGSNGERAYLEANASTCVACHGSDVLAIQNVPGEHQGCSCHNYGEADALKACQDCHVGQYAAHGFETAPAHGSGWFAASGHNTNELAAGGKIGAKSKFDGSQGIKLTWKAVEAFTITSVKDPDAIAGFAPGASFSLGQTGTVTAQWDLPTKSVFWPAVNDGIQDAPATAIKGLDWNSTVYCQDCHTNVAVGGPQGAAGNWGLDSNYPGDYSKAVLTKKVTSGDSFSVTNTGDSASGIAMLATLNPAPTDSLPNGFSDGTTGANAVICAKCHRLETVAAAGLEKPGQTWATVEGANTAHDSHHQDQNDNSGQCVNCHIAVPHGWKAPRLLVDAEEGEEYSPDAFLWEGGVKVREGMNSLAGLNNHLIIGADGMPAYVTGSGSGAVTANLAHVGTVIWDESQCSACGDHYGEDQKFWNGTTNAWESTDSTGANKSDTAIPVRITF